MDGYESGARALAGTLGYTERNTINGCYCLDFDSS